MPLSESIDSIIAFLQPAMRRGSIGRIRRGVEKEGLRVEPDGHVSQQPHPLELGSKLTHPYITTDYSEALLEYVTPVFCKPSKALEFLVDLHRFTYQYIGKELVWPASMPALLEGNESIPIADFGTSNKGRMKHVYRRGLDVRYGRIMQSIAGIHYNVSLPDELWQVLAAHETGQAEATSLDASTMADMRSRGYFRIIRNFRRHSWILKYLFGASPAIDRSFLDGRDDTGFDKVGQRTLISRYASSLRMSDLGYQNKVQNQLSVSYDSLQDYIKTLRYAVSTAWSDYERFSSGGEIGENGKDGWQQLNANILQIENEFYSDIRPKRVVRHHQTPTQALEAEGVEYIEVRCLDINPLLPVGIDETAMRFIDTFLMFCLLSTDAVITEEEEQALTTNQARIVRRGRDPELTLIDEGEELPLGVVGHRIISSMRKVAELLDSNEEASPHIDALDALAPRLDNPELTPAGRIYKVLTENNEDFVEWTLEQARSQASSFRARPIDKARNALFEQLSETSRIQQGDLERDDPLSFDEFVALYFEKAHRVAQASEEN
ncbi:Glutamate--cysteine ligase [Halomonadaceae bacterium LMG 33818]|uniref:glutamate--cysteine ligase n=1 Tax=Cernens ardua TaxID=3402176 RepID=UPI003EDC74E5